jgi:hypothetical protein
VVILQMVRLRREDTEIRELIVGVAIIVMVNDMVLGELEMMGDFRSCLNLIPARCFVGRVSEISVIAGLRAHFLFGLRIGTRLSRREEILPAFRANRGNAAGRAIETDARRQQSFPNCLASDACLGANIAQRETRAIERYHVNLRIFPNLHADYFTDENIFRQPT